MHTLTVYLSVLALCLYLLTVPFGYGRANVDNADYTDGLHRAGV